MGPTGVAAVIAGKPLKGSPKAPSEVVSGPPRASEFGFGSHVESTVDPGTTQA